MDALDREWTVRVYVEHLPELRSVRRWLLGTRDAHELYRKFGFHEPTPGVLLERLVPDSDRRPNRYRPA